MWKKLALVFLVVGMIFAGGLMIGLLGERFLPGRATTSFNSSTLLVQVQTLSQLVTVKYVLEKVINYEDAKWYGENRVLLIAHGIVKAGIQLDQLKAGDIQITGKKITLLLPRPRIMDVYLDDRRSQILERSTGLMRTFDKDLEQAARREAVEDLRRAAMEGGILSDASDRAKSELTVLLYQLGFTQVDFKAK